MSKQNQARQANVLRMNARRDPYEVAAERVGTILDDPETPQFLRDILDDALTTLTNETKADLYHPTIARATLQIGLKDADAQRLRLFNGSLSREPGTVE